MSGRFHTAIASTLPSEERLRARLAGLQARDWSDAALTFSAVLPEFDAVIGLPGAQDLAQSLARSRGVPLLTASVHPDLARWTLLGPPELPHGEAVLVTEQLTSGLAELETILLAARRQLSVTAVAAAIERTTAQGRVRLEMQGVTVHSVVKLADTPQGLKVERRFPASRPG